MAGEHTETAAHEGANGTTANGVQPERVQLTRAEQDAADRAAFIAGEDEDDADEAPVQKPSKRAVVEDDEDEGDAGDRDEDDTEDDDELEEVEDLDDEDDELEADDEDDEDDDTESKADPELAKRLSKVQKYEKKVRDQATAREKQFAAERDAFVAEWKPKIEAYEQFEKLKSRKSDPAGVLKALGYTEDDFEDVSKMLWALSKTGSSDPKNKDAVARMQANRELREKNEALEARLASLEGKLTTAERAAEENRQVEAYLGRVTKNIGDETPLVKKRMDMAPKSTKKALERVAYELAKKTGGLVDPKKVARTYEKKLARTVEAASMLRGDEKAASSVTVKGKPATKPAITVVDKTKKPAAVAAPAKKSGSLIPDRDDMIERLRMIERGELDPDADDAD